ncbi:MAG TPA: serine/threonine-protein kinase [Myxococcaceae bacterium]|nr:serine/threonine-protein kinase [Myxococcaceae bacterium]
MSVGRPDPGVGVTLLCYRCGSHVPESADACATCGQTLGTGGLRQATGTFSHKRASQGSVLGAPYKSGAVIAERYVMKDVLGSGPLGFVLRARDQQSDADVAIKLIHPRFLQTPEERKFFAERIGSVRALSHSNLARIYDDGEDLGWPFYATQYLEGLTLRKIIELRIEKGELFSLREVEPIFGQIASALDAAHGLGPHADLKPENVIILPDLLKVSDFGLGLAMPRVPFVQALRLRRADRYAAPEYISGSEVDHRADVYSLGVMLGEMLSGQIPDGAIPELTQINPVLPERLEGLYRKALNADPAARFSSAREMVEALWESKEASAPQPHSARAPAPIAGGPVVLLETVEPSTDAPAAPEEPAELTQPVMHQESKLLAPKPPASNVPDQPMESLQRVLHPHSWWTPRVRSAAWALVLCISGLIVGGASGYWLARSSSAEAQGTAASRPMP